MNLPRLVAATTAFVVVGAASVATAVSVSGPASVEARAWRVDPPPYRRMSPDERAAHELLDVVNEVRAEHGLAPVSWQSQVAAAAQVQAEYMASTREAGHTGPSGDAGARLTAQGYPWTTWGEVVGAGFPEPRSLVDAWMGSELHRRHLLGDFPDAGAAVVAIADGTPYWAMLFADTRDLAPTA